MYVYEVRSSMCLLNPRQALEEAFDFLNTSEGTQEGAWIKGLSREIKCQMTWLYLNEEKKKTLHWTKVESYTAPSWAPFHF